ncbi:MAG: DUF4396 domain-containing protein [Anaerolineae bacterium]|nr:DUF4396 domain-containing protein [Anaerolineae bacterium]
MRRIILIIAGLLGLAILFVPAYILWLTWSGADGSPPDGLLTLNTKDSTRLAAENPGALSITAAQTLFPAGNEARPNAVIRVSADTWQPGVAAAPLVRWLNGPLLLDDGATEIERELDRLQPEGVNALDGATVVRISLGQTSDSEDTTQIQAGSAPELAAQVDSLIERLRGEVQPHIWLVPDDPNYAIPAAYWAAQSGDVILFGGNPLPAATRQALERRGGQARIYLVGPDVESEDLSRYGVVLRVVAWDGVAAAVALASYRDEATGAGWGLDGTRYVTTHNFVLANRDDPALAIAGLSLGRFGKFGPLLWVERDQIPSATDQYLWKMKPEFFNTPAEGPFNHLWLLGGPEQISVKTQGWADLSQEIGAYRFEEAGLSGMEMIGVVWVVAGIVGGVWLLLHSWRRLPQMSAMMRATWVLLGLVLGPLAIWLYRHSYHRVPWMRHGEMTMWHRQGFGPALAASAMNRGFDGPLMLVISWVVTALGLPLLVFRGPGFWLGNSMMIGIFIAYFGALALHWLVMHAAMFMEHEKLSYGQAVRRAFQPAFFSMTAMAIGMMGFMWWIQMLNLMMEGMPEDDDIMWWGTTLFSILVGWLVALPIDAWLVQCNKQPGTM